MRTHRNSNTEIPEQKKQPVKPRQARPKTTWNRCQTLTTRVTLK